MTISSKFSICAADVFCGVGGLTHGLQQSGIDVKVGYDLDGSCQFAYEENNDANFECKDIREIKGEDIKAYFPDGSVKVLAGCAPCQPFSNHTNKNKNRDQDSRWGLLGEFARLIEEVDPDIVSMENVPNLARQSVFREFKQRLIFLGYFVNHTVVYCPDYGIPQTRKRLVLLASKRWPIELIEKTHTPDNYITVKKALGKLPSLAAGETDSQDPLHRAMNLTEINMKRIRQSKQSGSWKDWDEEILLECHKRATGKTYSSVYGRMNWEQPGPTMTTQFYLYGTGRFGHPDQDRAISLREGAILQTFPREYKFAESPEEIGFRKTATHIGNAVPVRLGEIIGKSILAHLEKLNVKEEKLADN